MSEPARGSEFLFSLDTPRPIRVNADEYCLKGWFIPSDQFRELSLRVDDISIPVFHGLPRPDVAAHLKRPAAEESGFIARFEAPRLDGWVSIVARGESEELVIADRIPVGQGERAEANAAAAARISIYRKWLATHEPELFRAEDIAHRIAEFAYRPVVSVLVPRLDTNAYFLTRSVESVLGQRYPYWQLCIAECGLTDSARRECVERITEGDRRVEFVRYDANEGATGARNACLEAARGDYAMLLDPDDEMHRFALLEVLRCLNSRPGAALVYSDEDRIDVFGRRSEPFFKPDFDRDAFVSFHYLRHLCAVRRDVAMRIGGFRRMCEEAQGWDFAMRAVEAIGGDAVSHIEKPLYHVRTGQEVQFKAAEANECIRKSGRAIVLEHVERTGRDAEVEPGLIPLSMRIRHGRRRGSRMAVFIRAQDGIFQEAALAADFDARWMRLYQVAGCTVRAYESREVAITLGEICADVLLFLNRPLDTLNHFFFEELAAQALRPECGLVTGISLDGEGRIVHSGFLRGDGGRLIDPCARVQFKNLKHWPQFNVVREVEAIGDEFFAVRRECFSSIGGASSVSALKMRRLVSRLAQAAHDREQRILVTPYAIATFDGAVPQAPVMAARRANGIRLNSNFESFEALRKASTQRKGTRAPVPVL